MILFIIWLVGIFVVGWIAAKIDETHYGIIPIAAVILWTIVMSVVGILK